MRVALIHDWLNSLGGAERVLIELHKIFPEAPVYTLFANQKFIDSYLPQAQIRTSWLQSAPFINKIYKYFLPFMPAAIESFDFSEYDVVLSSSVFFSKGIIVNPKTRHICYCYSPTRILWDRHSEFIPERKPEDFKKWLNRFAQHFLRVWDRAASQRVDDFVSISECVRSRILKYYRKDSKVIYPPFPEVITKLKPKPIKENGYYLIVSRLYGHKNIDIAIEAFNKLGLPLVIIGNGPLYHNLKNKAEKNIKFLGHLSDQEIINYYNNCRAFIMPQEEDFGLTPLEAMYFGKPVLALRKGGAIETIIEGKTGEFFDDPIPEGLADGIRRLNENYSKYEPQFIKNHVSNFSSEKFKTEILNLVA